MYSIYSVHIYYIYFMRAYIYTDLFQLRLHEFTRIDIDLFLSLMSRVQVMVNV